MSLRCAFSGLFPDKAHWKLVWAWVAAVALIAPAAVAAAPAPQTTLNDVEDEVMCPICGTLLELADSPQARREKVFVAKLIAAGKSKAEIKDALVAQYGSAVLAQPKASGFDLSAYLVPIIAFLVAATAAAFSVLRWRRSAHGDEPPGGAASVGPHGAAAERLETDLSRYDL
ncbi:MAG TPA: cytochrome c-type biogenesis protein CcmH [Solirubrobacterales bacterium]|nr:cytochrome c-type biogenesis protein CcmH [Solirubrobacterales bacterium]